MKVLIAIFTFLLVREVLKNIYEGWPRHGKIFGRKKWAHKGLYGQEFYSSRPPAEIENRFVKLGVFAPDGWTYIYVLPIGCRVFYLAVAVVCAGLTRWLL